MRPGWMAENTNLCRCIDGLMYLLLYVDIVNIEKGQRLAIAVFVQKSGNDR